MSKHKWKGLVAVVLAAIMVFAIGVTSAFAADNGKITITNARVGEKYSVYKVFDAVGDGTGNNGKISYRLMSGKNQAPIGFNVDEAGNVTYGGAGKELTADDIANIAEYVKNDLPVAGPTEAQGTTLEFSGLEDGYYYITTTSGTAVSVDSANHEVLVTDKNEEPVIKKIASSVGDSAGSINADSDVVIAQIGAKITYTATIEIKKGAQGYVFHDKMDQGLTYNDDIALIVDNQALNETNDYKKLDVSQPSPDSGVKEGDTLAIELTDTWLKDNVGKKVTITYSATVNNNVTAGTAFKNSATVTYGDASVTQPSEVTHYTAQIKVTKVDGDGQPLAGAGFVLAKTVDDTVYYYGKNADTGAVSWETDIENATELTTASGDGGNIIYFDGLRDGAYKLIEKTVPDGYNKAPDQDVTISADYTGANLISNASVTNNAGSLLPSTGGMGTTILYVVGGILIVGTVVALVARRRMNSEK